MAPEMRKHALSVPITYPQLPQLQSEVQSNYLTYPFSSRPSIRRTTPSASRAPTATQAAPSIRRPSIQMASTHAQTAPPFHQPASVINPRSPRATSTSNFTQKEEGQRPQPGKNQPEHPSRSRFAPVSSATLATPEGISAGRPNNEGQPRSPSAVARMKQSLEAPEPLRKAQEKLQKIKPQNITVTISPTIHNHNTNINNPQPGSNAQGRQSFSQSSSQHGLAQLPSSQPPSFQHASWQQPNTRQQLPIREPRVFQAYSFDTKRGYKSRCVWAATIAVLYLLCVLVWYCLSSQEIHITSPPKNIKLAAVEEKFAIAGSLQSSFQQSLANSHVSKADKAVLCDLSDRLAINQRDTTNSDSEVLSKLREIFIIGQGSNISKFGYKDDLFTSLYYYPISVLWPWTNTHASQRWTALAVASYFELPIQQLLAAGESHLNNFNAWKLTLEDLFNYLRKQEQLGSAAHAVFNSNLTDGMVASICALGPLSQRAHAAYNGTRSSWKEVEELEEQCRKDGKGCKKLGDLLLGGKVFEVLGKWTE
ncbi:MAG: hypothetical protein Q9192_003964 [Flavoplaca navasiana]